MLGVDNCAQTSAAVHKNLHLLGGERGGGQGGHLGPHLFVHWSQWQLYSFGTADLVAANSGGRLWDVLVVATTTALLACLKFFFFFFFSMGSLPTVLRVNGTHTGDWHESGTAHYHCMLAACKCLPCEAQSLVSVKGRSTWLCQKQAKLVPY